MSVRSQQSANWDAANERIAPETDGSTRTKPTAVAAAAAGRRRRVVCRPPRQNGPDALQCGDGRRGSHAQGLAGGRHQGAVQHGHESGRKRRRSLLVIIRSGRRPLQLGGSQIGHQLRRTPLPTQFHHGRLAFDDRELWRKSGQLVHVRPQSGQGAGDCAAVGSAAFDRRLHPRFDPANRRNAVHARRSQLLEAEQ